jgi:ligand-binding sensor domain-containing protein
MRSGLVLLLVFVCSLVHAERIPVRKFNVSNGLPSNSVRCIFKDRRGYIWIGTDNGLCRYDGAEFKIMDSRDGINQGKIWAITEDKLGNLWFSSYMRGLCYYDGKQTKTFSDKYSRLINLIRVLKYSQKYNCLIIGSDQGIALFDGIRFKKFKHHLIKRYLQVLNIDQYRGDFIISTNNDGLFKLEFNDGNLEKAKIYRYLSSINKSLYSTIVDDTLFYRNNSGSYQMYSLRKPSNSDTIKYIIPIVWNMVKTDKCWYAATWNVANPEGGLFRISGNKAIDASKSNGVDSKVLWCTHYDSTNHTLYTGSLDKGLYINNLHNVIKHVDKSEVFQDSAIYSHIYRDRYNTLWFATASFIFRIKDDGSRDSISWPIIKKKIIVYLSNTTNNNLQTLNTRNTIPRISGFDANVFTEDPYGNIYLDCNIGSILFNKNLDVLNYANNDGEYIHFTNSGTRIDGYRYGSVLVSYPPKYEKPDTFSVKDNNNPNTIRKCINFNNSVLIVSNGGLHIYYNKKFSTPYLKNNFPDNEVEDICKTADGKALIATTEGNIYLASIIEDSLIIHNNFRAGIDFYGNSIYKVYCWKNYYLVNTNLGINVFHGNEFLRIIGPESGLIDPYISSWEASADDKLYIGTSYYLYSTDLPTITKPITQSKDSIYIRRIYARKNRWFPENDTSYFDIISTDKIELDWNQTPIRIDFSCIRPEQKGKSLYRYKIRGIEENESIWNTQGSIELSSINPGTYSIEFEGKNIHEGITYIPRKITLIIHPPWWKTLPFVVTALLCGLLLFFFLTLKRVQYLRRKDKEKSDFEKLILLSRMESVQARMNPHFIFNAMNSIQNFIIDSDAENALFYTSEFSKLIRQTLDFSTERLIPLDQEIEYIRRYVRIQQLRFPKVYVEFNVSNDLDTVRIMFPPMLIQPFLENAFEHAFTNRDENPTITINYSKQGKFIFCEVNDNGVGIRNINVKNGHRSVGIKLIREKINILNRESGREICALTIHSNTDTDRSGTGICIQFEILH